MAGSFGSMLGDKHAQHARKRMQIRSVWARGRHRPTRRLTVTGALILSSAAIAAAVLPLATSASAAGTWTLTLGTPTGTTTTGFVANGSVTPDGNDGFVQVLIEPLATPLTTSSPTATSIDILNSPGTSPIAVSLPVDQLSPNTAYHYELLATEDDDDGMFTSSAGNITTPPAPTGTGTPIDPPNNPPSIGIFGQCTTDSDCVSDMNGVRAAQEQLPPLALPTNWGSLTEPEQLFVWTNLERTSRGEAAIPNLVNTYDANIQTGLTDGDDPGFTGVPCCGGSIESSYPTVLSSMYGWLYNDGPGGTNSECTTTDMTGCWGHRNNILGNASNFSANPNEMDAGAGTNSSTGNPDYDALFDPNPNPPPPANIVFTWAQELPFLKASVPAITSVSPTSGPTTGNTTVTITGTNFTGATKVLFGNVAATSFSVVSATEITAVSPAEAAALHNIYVTTPSGTSATVTADQYTYVGPPAITAVSPSSGPTTGNTTVTITGTGFTGATKVLFGNVAATSFSVVSSTEITAVSPAEAAALHNTYVTTPVGTSATVTADEYTFVGLPAITAVSPSSGPTTGNTTVTITGTGFSGATKVLFGNVAAKSFSVVSATEITAVSPAEAAALHNIYVTTPSGTSATVTADEYTFVGLPAITAVSPTSGPTTGNTTVTITGTNFSGATKVLFGNVAAKSFSVVSATEITAVSPAEAAALHNIYVTTPEGTSATVTADQYTFVA